MNIVFSRFQEDCLVLSIPYTGDHRTRTNPSSLLCCTLATTSSRVGAMACPRPVAHPTMLHAGDHLVQSRGDGLSSPCSGFIRSVALLAGEHGPNPRRRGPP